LEITEVVKALGPIVFFGGGAYAVFKWRLGKIEKAVEKMADTCVTNRTTCLAGVSAQIVELRDDLAADFEESKQDRKNMKESIHSIDVTVARLDQKIIDRNGVWFAKSKPSPEDS
jgi:hypothetical protein